MAFLLQKFLEAARTLAKSPTFARDPRLLQFETDINRLFLYTSYYRLGKNAEEKDAEEIIDLACKASVSDQQKQVQDNVHTQVKALCGAMDEILLPDSNSCSNIDNSSSNLDNSSRRSGLSFAVGKTTGSYNQPVIPATRSLTQEQLSNSLKERIGYTLDIKRSQIPHPEAGEGLFISGEAEAGAVIAFYPGVIYSPAYYRNIPGYPKIDAQNSYLITRYDGLIVNAQPWARGGQTREPWDGVNGQRSTQEPGFAQLGANQLWRILISPTSQTLSPSAEILERRNPLALGHFANHPERGETPNLMICPYDFPLQEKEMRTYIPNICFGNEYGIKMRRIGSFWFKSRTGEGGGGAAAVLRTLVLVATRRVADEELFLNYRLSNTKRRPTWYSPVDEEEDRKRWG
ncbi:C5orf35 [Wolffia australiana]